MVLARTEKRRHLAVLCLLNCRAEEPDLLLAFCVVVLSPPIRFRLSQLAILFLPHIFLGTASGQFLRPAASRLLLSRFLPYPIGFHPIKQPLALEAAAS